MLPDLQQSLKTLSIAHLEGSTKLTQGDRKVRTFLESHQSPENLQREAEEEDSRCEYTTCITTPRVTFCHVPKKS